MRPFANLSVLYNLRFKPNIVIITELHPSHLDLKKIYFSTIFKKLFFINFKVNFDHKKRFIKVT